MATTSFLYHTLGLAGYRHLSSDYEGGTVFHHVALKQESRRCRGCRARWYDLRLSGGFERSFRALPIGSRAQFVVLHGHRQHCRRCGRDLREPIVFAHGKAQHLKRLERYAVELCQLAPIKAVARHLGVGWDVVKDLYKGHLRRRLKKRSLAKVRYLAIDEFATHKGHRYMTVVLDLGSGAIVYAQEGKDAEALIPFLKQLRRARVPLQAVAIDMSVAYRNAVREVFGDQIDIVCANNDEMALGAIEALREALAMGADAVAIGTGAMVAMGCTVCLRCHEGRCAFGIGTQDPELRKRFPGQE